MADGKQEIYDFSVNDQIQPKLTVSGGNERSFTWNPATGQALKDGEWTYDIRAADLYENAKIQRTNDQNQSEYWFDDKANGREITKNTDGVVTTTIKFTSGPVIGLTRSIIESGNGVEKEVFHAVYDENGRLVRKLDRGATFVYEYYNNTNHLSKVTKRNPDGTVVAYKELDAMGRLRRYVKGNLDISYLERNKPLIIKENGIVIWTFSYDKNGDLVNYKNNSTTNSSKSSEGTDSGVALNKSITPTN
jgi:hypothetical protein